MKILLILTLLILADLARANTPIDTTLINAVIEETKVTHIEIVKSLQETKTETKVK